MGCLASFVCQSPHIFPYITGISDDNTFAKIRSNDFKSLLSRQMFGLKLQATAISGVPKSDMDPHAFRHVRRFHQRLAQGWVGMHIAGDLRRCQLHHVRQGQFGQQLGHFRSDQAGAQ